jgi:hypothetical protein
MESAFVWGQARRVPSANRTGDFMAVGKQYRRLGTALAIFVAAALLASDGVANETGQMTGYAYVTAVDASAGTITLAGARFRVTPQTEWVGPSGSRISLDDLHPVRQIGSDVLADGASYVRYRGVRRGDSWVLQRLLQPLDLSE